MSPVGVNYSNCTTRHNHNLQRVKCQLSNQKKKMHKLVIQLTEQNASQQDIPDQRTVVCNLYNINREWLSATNTTNLRL